MEFKMLCMNEAYNMECDCIEINGEEELENIETL